MTARWRDVELENAGVARLCVPASWPTDDLVYNRTSASSAVHGDSDCVSTGSLRSDSPETGAPSGGAERDPLPDLLDEDDRALVAFLRTTERPEHAESCAAALAIGLQYGSLHPDASIAVDVALRSTAAWTSGLQSQARSSNDDRHSSLMYRMAAVVAHGGACTQLLRAYCGRSHGLPPSTVLIDPQLTTADVAELRRQRPHTQMPDEAHVLVVLTRQASVASVGVQALQRLLGARVEVATTSTAGPSSRNEVTGIVCEYLSPRSFATRFDHLSSPPSVRASASRWRATATGVANMRDLAVSHFPPGVVFRSADLQALDAAHPHATQRWKAFAADVRVVIDLRSAPEVRKNGAIGAAVSPNASAASSNTAAGSHGAQGGTTADQALHPNTATQAFVTAHRVRRIHAPIFTETDYSPAAIAKRHGLYKNGSRGFLQAYDGILRNVGPTLRIVVEEVCKTLRARQLARSESSADADTASGAGRPESFDTRGVLIHCSAGKDRTGILCALLLLLAKVEPWVVAEEYGQTRAGLRERRVAIMKSAVALSAAPPAATAAAAAATTTATATATTATATTAGAGAGAGGNAKSAELAALRMMDSPPHVMRVVVDRLLSGVYNKSSPAATLGGRVAKGQGMIDQFFVDNGIDRKTVDYLRRELLRDRAAGPELESEARPTALKPAVRL